VTIAAGFNNNAYGLEVLKKPRVGIFRAIVAVVSAVGLALLTAFFLKASGEYSRLVLLMATIGSIALIAPTRFMFGKFAWRLMGGNPLNEVVIVDGVFFPHSRNVRVIDASQAGLAPNASDPLMLDRLGTVLVGVDRVLVTCRPERRALWALLLKGANVQGEVLAPEVQEIGALGIGRAGEQSTMVVSCGPLDLRSRALKRALDLAITLPLVVFLMPLLVVVACAIKIEGGGPVFFRQQRLGRGNRLFSMLKFRSMRADLCDASGNQSTQRDDARITVVGRIIRSTSIDELPQLLNVLKGEMSLVGPRPHALGSLAGKKLFWEVDQRYWHRHACKPGITGLAQVRGFRGATHQGDDLKNRLMADLEYVAGWSILRDVAILLRTFRVLVHQNAY
jgi:lipopolysaccharide/colanic/teichoic acid biosynthesis glycosyltransferase